jgi:hypothetical protein
MSLQIRRGENGWMELSCNYCHRVIWSGEESFWDIAKLTSLQFIHFLWRHQCGLR